MFFPVNTALFYLQKCISVLSCKQIWKKMYLNIENVVAKE